MSSYNLYLLVCSKNKTSVLSDKGVKYPDTGDFGIECWEDLNYYFKNGIFGIYWGMGNHSTFLHNDRFSKNELVYMVFKSYDKINKINMECITRLENAKDVKYFDNLSDAQKYICSDEQFFDKCVDLFIKTFINGNDIYYLSNTLILVKSGLRDKILYKFFETVALDEKINIGDKNRLLKELFYYNQKLIDENLLNVFSNNINIDFQYFSNYKDIYKYPNIVDRIIDSGQTFSIIRLLERCYEIDYGFRKKVYDSIKPSVKSSYFENKMYCGCCDSIENVEVVDKNTSRETPVCLECGEDLSVDVFDGVVCDNCGYYSINDLIECGYYFNSSGIVYVSYGTDSIEELSKTHRIFPEVLEETDNHRILNVMCPACRKEHVVRQSNY